MAISIVLIIAGAFVIVPILLWYLQLFKYRNLKIPGPKPWPIVGNVFDIGTDIAQIVPRFRQMQMKYGGIFKLHLGPTAVNVVLSKPEYIKYFLNSTVHVHKSAFYNIFKPLLGDGVATADADIWRLKRKQYTPAFHGTILENFTEIFNEGTNRLIAAIHETKGDHIDVHPYINEFTLDCINETALGLPYDSNPNRYVNYFKNLHKFMDLGMARVFSLYKMVDSLYKYTSDYKERQQCLKTLWDKTDSQIKRKIAERQNQEASVNQFDTKRMKPTFLDMLLDLHKDDENFSIQKIRYDVDTFIFAGHDTVSSSLSFMLYELSKHPDIQQKIYEEIDNILGDNIENLTIMDLNKLEYTDCVIKESLRFNTTVPFVERRLHEDVELDGIKIPKGTNISFLICAVHESEELYEEPMKFDPTRFLPENIQKRHTHSYLPFLAGPRNCIGYRYAMLLMKVVLVKIVRNFKILRPLPDFQLEVTTHGITTSKNGFPVQFKSR